jgi:crotonobetainyl-CoA hydratase
MTAGQEPAAVLARQGAVAVITLNRPHVMNAVDARMSDAIVQALSDLAEDPALRVG